MAIAIAVIFLVFDYLPPSEPTAEWWLTRPLWLIGPALATYPFLLLYQYVARRREQQGATVDLAG